MTGTGKTLTAIAIAGAAHKTGKVERLLVVAPTSVCAVWEKEFYAYANFPFAVEVLLGTQAQRFKRLSALEYAMNDRLKVAVINYEGCRIPDALERLKQFKADMVICDESQRIKSHTAKQSKAVQALGDRTRYKLILSGTPLQNNAMDIYSQYRFLDPTVFGRNYSSFEGRYAIKGQWGYEVHKIVAYKNMDELIRKTYSIAYRVTKEEALDLPAQTFETRYVSLSPRERSEYDQLRRNSYAELADGGTVTAETVLTKLLRLQQMAGGFLKKDGSETVEQVGRGKLDALADILEDYVLETGKKLVVFARFIPEVKAICELCQKKKLGYIAIHGDVKASDRGALIERFQADPKTMVAVGQIDTLGVGVTLTAADTTVYYSNTFNFATYDQSLSRIHRLGQTQKCTYIHLIAENTVDEHVMEALSQKKSLADTVIDDWRRYFE